MVFVGGTVVMVFAGSAVVMVFAGGALGMGQGARLDQDVVLLLRLPPPASPIFL